MLCKATGTFRSKGAVHTTEKLPVSHMPHHNHYFGMSAAQFVHHLPVRNIHNLAYLLLCCTYCPNALKGDVHHISVVLLAESLYLTIFQLGKTACHIYVNYTSPVPQQVKEKGTHIREDVENPSRQQGNRIGYPPQSPK